MSHIVSEMYANPDYLDDLMVRMVFNSAAIENNTITIDETRSLLVDGIIPNFRRKVSSRELYELANLKSAWHHVILHVDEPITIRYMHHLHKLVMSNIDEKAGSFKKSQHMIGGELTTPPEKTPTEVLYLIDHLYHGSLAYAQTEHDIIRAAIAFHIGYEKIHPYPDGNGRTGRLLLNHILLANQVAPFVIRAEDKAYYYKCLRERDEASLANYAAERIGEERLLIDAVSGGK